MRQVATKREKRDMRRALGAQAVGVLAIHEQSLQQIAATVARHSDELMRLSAESRAHSFATASLADVVNRPTRWGRLKWIWNGK